MTVIWSWVREAALNPGPTSYLEDAAVKACYYESLGSIQGSPELGERVAYRILEMGQNYCPEVASCLWLVLLIAKLEHATF